MFIHQTEFRSWDNEICIELATLGIFRKNKANFEFTGIGLDPAKSTP